VMRAAQELKRILLLRSASASAPDALMALE
jgi:hypothetical protein